MKKRALISVSDKTGIVDFAKGLVSLGIEIISTAGTKKVLSENNISCISISDITNFEEIMDGRVKTLHPNVHGALLCVRDNESHLEDLKNNDIDFIDIVVVNLYPFSDVLESGQPHETIIENIDIGGPSMLRSASKNYKFVTCIVDSKDYSEVLDNLKKFNDVPLNLKQNLAAKAFSHTAFYDSLIAGYLTSKSGNKFPKNITIGLEKKIDLRYGENHHQEAAFYVDKSNGYSIKNAEQIHGKELSYNNILDANSAINLLFEFKEPCVVAVKHTNPCGVGIGQSLVDAFKKAYKADSLSIFGGIIATNCIVDRQTATIMNEIFLELVIARGFDEDALQILKEKKNIRLLKFDPFMKKADFLQFVSVNGGALLCEGDNAVLDVKDLKVVTAKKPTDKEVMDLINAQKIVKHVKSNAIVLYKDGMTYGVGAGQMSRVQSVKIAIEKAEQNSFGCVMASDAFFPKEDSIQFAAKNGITAIIQPGGSIADQDIISECDKLGIAMVFTGVRHFKH